jgi:FAD/FMN-containing dehydrogenase
MDAPPPTARPTSIPEAASLLRAGARLRPVGARRSAPALLHADAGWLDGTGLRELTVLGGDRVRVGGGVTLRALSAWLAEADRRLPCAGTSWYPTVAGAIGTGVHGTGHDTGSMSDAATVAGLTLVTPSGEVIRLSDDRPVDAPLLAAARLHLGAFGLVADVTLRVTAGAHLRRTTRPVPVDALLDPDLPRAADHVEAWWVPHTDAALVVTRHPAAGTAPRRGGLWQGLGRGLTEDAPLRALIAAGRAWPALTPTLAGWLARFGRGVSDRTGRWDRLTVGPRWLDAVDAEYALPADRLGDALAALRALTEATPLHLPVNLRWGRADRGALLSPAADRDTVWVDVGWHRAVPGGDAALAAVDAALGALGGRPHWGKLGWRNPSPPGLAAWAEAQRAVDPDGRCLNDHLRRLLRGAPLREPPCAS